MNNKIQALLVAISLLCNIQLLQAQKVSKNKEPFEQFYARVDSFNKIQPTIIIAEAITTKLKTLDKKEPYFLFSEATSEYEFKNDKYDDAALFFYVGLIRYNYFMGVNPEYAPGDGWMICESMRQTYKDRIELYLKTNITKYIAVLKFATAYCTKNNYDYWQKPLDKVKFQKAIEPYAALLKELETNRPTYEKQYLEERNLNLGKTSAKTATSSGEKRWYRYTPMQLDIDTATSKLDIYQYYKSERSHHHYRYVKSKERLAVLEFIDKQNWNDLVKLEIFKLVTWDYGEKYPLKDLYQTEAEHKEWLTDDTAKNINKKQEKDTEDRLIQLLGEQAGKKFLSDVIDVKIKFGEEFQKYLGK
jgi:hypothetical protein